MASKKPADVAKHLSEKQIRRIWQDLKPITLFERLKILQPNAKWSLQGQRLSGCCPYHQDNTPSFHIYIDRAYAKCFGGGCEKFIWNPIKLWAKLTGTTESEALMDLKQAFGLKFLGASVQAQFQAWEFNQELKRRIMDACHTELLNALETPNDPRYAVAQQAAQWLVQTRKIPVEAIPTLTMLGIMPPKLHLIQFLQDIEAQELEEVIAEAKKTGDKKIIAPHKYSDDAEIYLDNLNGWYGAVVFRMDITNDIIGRLKMRRPGSKDIRFLDDPHESDLGFFGLGWNQYNDLLGADKKSYVSGVYLVEGEFDALSIMAQQALTGSPNLVVVAVGGNAQNDKIDNLRHMGFDKVYLFADRPGAKKGEKLIKEWLKHIKDLRAFVFTGYDIFPGQCTDPDEVVCTVGIDALSKVLLDTGNPQLFQTPPDWVYEAAEPEIEAIAVTDERGRIETAAAWGTILRNRIDCDLFIMACEKGLNIRAAQLKREIVAKEEDEPAFVLRLADVLTSIFYPVGQRSTDSDRRLFLWHKEKNESTSIGLADDASIERELGNKLGPSYQFFLEKVGTPAFLDVPDAVKEGGKYLQKLDKDFRWYYRQALTLISQTVPDYDYTEHRGQGLHVMRNEDPKALPTLYLVNGRDVYCGVFENEDDLTWTKIDGPAHNGHIFDVGERQMEKSWLKSVRAASDLQRAYQVNLMSMWDRMQKILTTGWAFKNHAVTVDFLTGHLLATTINKAYRRQVVVSFQGDTGSGKSKLNLGLIGGSEVERLHLISNAVPMQSFSPAGIRMTMNNKVMPLCLDEFEDEGGPGDKKARAVQETLEMFRNLSGEQNKYTMGSRNGKPQVFDMHFFLFLSAINPARKVQDANRMIVINMDRVEGRPKPEDVISHELGLNYVADLKRDMDVGLFPQIAKLQRIYDELEFEYGEQGKRPLMFDQRYFQALFPAMSIMKLLGKDYRSFAKTFCDANFTPQTMGSENTDSAQLFSWVTQSGQLHIRTDNGEYTANALQLLANPDHRELLNSSASGLFYDEASELLVVNWTMAIQGVLRFHSRWGRETNTFNLKTLAGRHQYAVSNDDLEASGALNRLKSRGLLGVTADLLTGYRVSHLVRIPQAIHPTPVRPVSEPKTAVVKESDDAGDHRGGAA